MDTSHVHDFDYRLKAPFCAVLSGGSQSGKTTLTVKILERRAEIIDHEMKSIVYCYTEWQDRLFKELKEKVPIIEFHKGLPTEFSDGTDEHSLVVMDDLMTEASKSEDATNAFTRTSHHRNVSILFLTQNFFFKNLRTMTTNIKYLCVMKNPRDNAYVNVISRQMNGGRKNLLMEEAFQQCMSIPYGYMFIDYSQDQNDKFRIRNNVFPDENCIVFCSK